VNNRQVTLDKAVWAVKQRNVWSIFQSW